MTFTARFLEPYQPQNLQEQIEHVVSNGLLREGKPCYYFGQTTEEDKNSMIGLRYALTSMTYHTSQDKTTRDEAFKTMIEGTDHFIRHRRKQFQQRPLTQTKPFYPWKGSCFSLSAKVA